MSEGSVYQRKDGRWCGKYKALDGTWKYVYRKTKAQAKKALREALAARDAGMVPTKRAVNVGSLVEDWLERSRDEVSERTQRNRKSLVNVHIRNQPIATKKPNALTEDYLKRFYASKSPATAQRLHTILKSVLGHRMPNVKKPRKEDEREIQVLNPEQVNRLLAYVRGTKYECVFVLGATVGLRIGEILALRAGNIDLTKGTLTVRHTLWKGRVLPPKTRSSRRTIKLPARAMEALQRHIVGDGFLFQTKSGKPLDESNFHRWFWKPALRECGLPNIHFHDLRHGVVSHLLANNVPVAAISKYCGHANPGVTMAVYAHWLEDTDEVAAAMDSALSA